MYRCTTWNNGTVEQLCSVTFRKSTEESAHSPNKQCCADIGCLRAAFNEQCMKALKPFVRRGVYPHAQRFRRTYTALLHPERSRVDVFRSWSCSQPIRHGLQRRAATLDFNSYLNSLKDMSKCPLFAISYNSASPTLQRCQALNCRTRFHRVRPNLCNKSSRTRS